jgi:tRNA(adenine34) deaminase
MLAVMAKTDEEWMREALEEAREAERRGEVPVGAVLVRGDACVARGGNRTIAECDPTAHAEIGALRAAARAARNHRLEGVTLYVTVEPCAMCAGAIVQARVDRVVYGADDLKGGAFRSCFAVLGSPLVNYRVEVVPGVLAEECGALLQAFFAARR